MKIERIMMIRPGSWYLHIGYAQPLGLLYLISSLRQKYPGRFEIELVEQALHYISSDGMAERIKKFKPDLVCLSALSWEKKEVKEIAQISKEYNPAVPVILGGPHATTFYDKALKDTKVDIAVIGEGEMTFLDLMDRLLNDKPIDDAKGIAFRRNGQIVVTEPREYIENLDAIPLPAWDYVDFKVYGKVVSMNGWCHSPPWAILFTTRACPFRCVYCHHIFGKKIRKRSVENVMEEIELLTGRFGVRELHIVDDIFNLDLPRAKLICDEIVKRGIKVKIAFPNGLRADMIDRELIQKLKAAGCYTITYAVETASPRMQKAIKKNLDLEKAKQAIEWTDAEGIITQSFFMIGFPGESLEEINQTIRFALDSKLLRAWIFNVIIYPRTDLLELAKTEFPNYDFSNWDDLDYEYWGTNTFYTEVTGVDLVKIHRNAVLSFFLRPTVIIKILWRFPKNKFLFRGMYWALHWTIVPIFKLENMVKALGKMLRVS